MTWLLVALFPVVVCAGNESIVWGQTTTTGDASEWADGAFVSAFGDSFGSVRRDFTVASSSPPGSEVQLDVYLSLLADGDAGRWGNSGHASLQIYSNGENILSKSVDGAEYYRGTNTIRLEVGGSYSLFIEVSHSHDPPDPSAPGLIGTAVGYANLKVQALPNQIKGTVLSCDQKSIAGATVKAISVKAWEQDQNNAVPLATAVVDSAGHYSLSVPRTNMFVFAEASGWKINPESRGVTMAFITEQELIDQGPIIDVPFVGTKDITVKTTTEFTGFQYFLDGVDFEVELLIEVDWGCRFPGEIIVEGSVEERGVAVGFPGGGRQQVLKYPLKVNVGKLGVGKVTVTAVSRNDDNDASNFDGDASPPSEANFLIMRSLPYKGNLVVHPVRIGTDAFHYIGTIKLTDPLLNAVAPVILDTVPFVGGSRLITEFTEAKLELKVRGSTAELTGYLIGTLNRLQGTLLQTVEIGPLFRMTGLYEAAGNTSGDWTWKGTVGAKAKLPLLNPDPWQFTWPLINLPGYGKVRIDLEGDLLFGANGTIGDLLGGNLPLERWNGSLKVTPKGRGTAAIGTHKLLAGEAWLQCTHTADFKFPGNPDNFQDQYGYVTIGFTVVLLGFQYEYEFFHSVEWWHDKLHVPVSFAGAMPRWQPIDRSYQANTRYDHAIPAVPRRLRSELKAFNVEPLQTSIFPEPTPSLASGPTNLIAAWIADDPTRDNLNRTIAVSARFDGTNWSFPQPLGDDGTADFGPQLKTLNNGRIIAVWVDARRVLTTATEPEEILGDLELSATFWDPLTLRWSDPQRLTSNACVDHNPIIVGDDADDLIVVWTANLNNALAATPESPDRLQCAHWDGAVWTASEVIAELAAPIHSYSAVYRAGRGDLIVSVSTDGATGAPNDADSELFRASLENGRWGQFARATSNSVPDLYPELVVNSAGHRVLIWLAGDSLQQVREFDFIAAETIVPGDAGHDFSHLVLARGPEDRLAMMWRNTTAEGADLCITLFEPETGNWSVPKKATDDSAIERTPALAWMGSSQLAGLYARTGLISTNVIVRNSAGLMSTNTISKPGPITDLYWMDYVLGGDWAVDEEVLRTDPANPVPGAVVLVSAGIINAGDQTAPDVVVAFCEEQSGGVCVEIGRTNVTRMRPGETRLLTWIWQRSARPDSTRLVVRVDPDSALEDRNRSNNTATLVVGMPDPALEFLSWSITQSNRLMITAGVANVGGASARGCVLEFRTGTNTASSAARDVGPLNPGERVTVEWETEPPARGLELVFGARLTGLTLEVDASLDNNFAEVTAESSVPPVRLEGHYDRGTRSFTLTFNAELGVAHVVEVSNDLLDWSPLQTITAATRTVFVTDPTPFNTSPRFYRVRRSR